MTLPVLCWRCIKCLYNLKNVHDRISIFHDHKGIRPDTWVGRWLTSSVHRATFHHETHPKWISVSRRCWQRACVSWWEEAGDFIRWREAWGALHAALCSSQVRSSTSCQPRSAALSAPHCDFLHSSAPLSLTDCLKPTLLLHQCCSSSF